MSEGLGDSPYAMYTISQVPHPNQGLHGNMMIRRSSGVQRHSSYTISCTGRGGFHIQCWYVPPNVVYDSSAKCLGFCSRAFQKWEGMGTMRCTVKLSPHNTLTTHLSTRYKNVQ